MDVPAVAYCQEQITKLDLEIRAAIQDIQECKAMNELKELNRLVSTKFAELKNKLSHLEKLALEQDKETDKVATLKSVSNYRNQMNVVQSMLRKSNLASQLAMEKLCADSLLRGGTEIRKRTAVSEDSPERTASNVTQNLMTLAQMMSDQVKFTEQTMGNLVSSSQQIGETHEELKNVSGHIYNSKKLLTKYGRRELTDKLLILLALIFFFCTVLYVIKKRLFG